MFQLYPRSNNFINRTKSSVKAFFVTLFELSRANRLKTPLFVSVLTAPKVELGSFSIFYFVVFQKISRWLSEEHWVLENHMGLFQMTELHWTNVCGPLFAYIMLPHLRGCCVMVITLDHILIHLALPRIILVVKIEHK